MRTSTKAAPTNVAPMKVGTGFGRCGTAGRGRGVLTRGMDRVVFRPSAPFSGGGVRSAGRDAVEVERRSRVALNICWRRRSRSLRSSEGRTAAAQVEQTRLLPIWKAWPLSNSAPVMRRWHWAQ